MVNTLLLYIYLPRFSPANTEFYLAWIPRKGKFSHRVRALYLNTIKLLSNGCPTQPPTSSEWALRISSHHTVTVAPGYWMPWLCKGLYNTASYGFVRIPTKTLLLDIQLTSWFYSSTNVILINVLMQKSLASDGFLRREFSKRETLGTFLKK